MFLQISNFWVHTRHEKKIPPRKAHGFRPKCPHPLDAWLPQGYGALCGIEWCHSMQLLQQLEADTLEPNAILLTSAAAALQQGGFSGAAAWVNENYYDSHNCPNFRPLMTIVNLAIYYASVCVCVCACRLGHVLAIYLPTLPWLSCSSQLLRC